MDKFKELLMKKKKEGKMLDPKMAGHKMEIIQQLMEMMSGEMGENLKGLKKVTVAAPDKEGLEKGLEKAQEVIGEESMEEGEECEEESEDSDEASKLKSQIAELKSKIKE